MFNSSRISPDTSTDTPPNLAALVGSRICHDLINPLGAIGNGIELLGMAGSVGGPEMGLVEDSVAGAMARLKHLRLAFGDASADQTVARAEVEQTLAAAYEGGRLTHRWSGPDPAPRRDVRLALLAAMCIETALPLGGQIDVSCQDGAWRVTATHDRLTLDPVLWVPLGQGACPVPLAAAQVHFGLISVVAAEVGKTLRFGHGVDWVKIEF